MSEPIEEGDDGELARLSTATAISHLRHASGFSALRIDQDANSRAGCMIGGPAWSFRRALGFDQCLLLHGRIVWCQHDATREEYLS